MPLHFLHPGVPHADSSFRLLTFALPSLAALALPLLVIAMGCGVSNAAAQTDKYPRMAAIGQYQMEESAEIQLARSAAPNSISRDATILVLRRQGYETAVEGKNGFVCMVDRSWMAAFDWPEFWNPKVRAADCMNPQAARSILPIAFLAQQDGDGRSFQGGDPIGDQSGVREQTTAGRSRAARWIT